MAVEARFPVYGLLWVVVLAGCQTTATLAHIGALEDRRSLGGGQLVAWTHADAPLEVRSRALLALARLQDPATVPDVVAALGDPAAPVRELAAFAAGQLGLAWVPLDEPARAALALAVLQAELAEPAETARDAELEALGRLGTPASLVRVTSWLTPRGPFAARAALAIGVAVKRGASPPVGGRERLEALSGPGEASGARFAAAWALVQLKAPASVPAQLAATRDDEAEVRAVSAKGLGEHGGAEAVEALEPLLLADHARVAAEATRALARIAVRCADCQALRALESLSRWVAGVRHGAPGGPGQPLLALAQAPLPAAAGPLLARLRASLQAGLTAPDQRLREDVASLDCRLAAAADRLAGTLDGVQACGGGLVAESRRLALGLRELAAAPPSSPDARAEVARPFLTSPRAQVRLAAVEALAASGSRAAVEWLAGLLEDKDPVLAAAAATGLATLGATELAPRVLALAHREAANVDVAPALAQALGSLKTPEAVPELRAWLAHPNETVRAAAAGALAILTGLPVPVPRVEVVRGEPPSAALPAGAQLVLETVRGTLRIALYSADAPRTAGTLATLARQGFFDGLTFHRVVPDFVVQGGDPRGDGEGGPGFTIRCEVNRHPYRRGTVGMALSGKDTGGSQFFVALSPQPHLEGRYTVVGEVVAGLEVADALLEGDLITRARVEAGAP
jgi:cyclophilin family peptidyl-prolyl cis-trans isomerase/HEAT repeat protein